MCNEKICNFYANEVHFGVAIVPFVANKIKENNKICTLLSKNVNKEIENIISKINIDENLKHKILEINWDKSTSNKIDLKQYIESQLKENSDLYVIINGNKQEVEEKNKIIEEIRKENEDKNINLVNCFEINDEKINEGFLENYHKILNSSGCRYLK